MSKKLYVGNIPFTSTEEEISGLFSPHGTVVSVTIIKDRDSGRSRGFCFVEFQDDSAATNAISALNGTSFGGRNIVVNEAKERSSNDRGGGRGGNGGYRDRDDRGRRDRY